MITSYRMLLLDGRLLWSGGFIHLIYFLVGPPPFYALDSALLVLLRLLLLSFNCLCFGLRRGPPPFDGLRSLRLGLPPQVEKSNRQEYDCA
jgi:hypothetical protein